MMHNVGIFKLVALHCFRICVEIKQTLVLIFLFGKS